MKTVDEALCDVEDMLGIEPSERLLYATIECFRQGFVSYKRNPSLDISGVARTFKLDPKKLESHFFWFFYSSKDHQPYYPVSRGRFADSYRRLKRARMKLQWK